MTNLLATKLHRPNLPPRRVERPRLVERLRAGLSDGHPITLISAPAGFGKTVCAVEWLDTFGEPVAWLSLDAADDEPGRFFTYLLSALQSVLPDLGSELLGVLRAGQIPPSDVIASTLLNGLLTCSERFVLVLDDFHHIQDPSILKVFVQLIASPPPALHLALLTREDPPLPLARLRAHNGLSELRAADLSFTRAEIDRFLSDVLGLSLSAADTAALAERTEGWAAGLQLAGLSLRDRPDPSRFIAALTGSHRFILSYLTEEVLNRQPEDIQQFLLQTAILDRLTGGLCDAVAGRTDSHALLGKLLDANLFLVPLDDDGHWYRYHNLFAGLLRDQHKLIPAETAAGLHQRAARWLSAAAASSSEHLHPNERAALVGEAIHHALAAADYAFALQLIETHAASLLHQWYARTVREWLEALPPEWSARSPRASLAFVWMHLMRGEFQQARPYIERLAHMFAAAPALLEEPPLLAEWLALQSSLANAQARPQDALHLAEHALEVIPPGDTAALGQIYLGQASAYQQMDDFPAAVEAYRKIIAHGRAAGNLSVELLGISALGLLLLERGRLQDTFDLALQGIDRIERSGMLPPINIAIYGELGQVYYHRGEFDLAGQAIQRSTQLSALTGFQDPDLFYGIFRSRLALMQSDLDEAARQIENVTRRSHTETPVVVQEEVIAQQVRVDLALGRLAAAETALAARGFGRAGIFDIPETLAGHIGPHRPDELPVISLHDRISAPAGLLYNTALRFLLYRGKHNNDMAELQRARKTATTLIDALQRRGYLPLTIDTLLLRAQLHAALDDAASTKADICAAVELAEPEGFISIFLENRKFVQERLVECLAQDPVCLHSAFIRQVLAAFTRLLPPAEIPEHPVVQIGLVELLTAREIEVLGLIGQGLTYNQIAAQLVVSLNTVRTHVKSIYGKLGVDNRTAAVKMAHRHHIL